MAWQTALPNVNPKMVVGIVPSWSFGGATGGGSAPPTTGQLWPR